MIAEISQALKQVTLSAEQKHNLTAIVNKIHKGAGIEAVILAYTQLISILLENLANEKKTSAQFLSALNNSLNSVKSVIDQSLGHLSEHEESKDKANKEVMSNLKDFHKNIDNPDLSQLKENVSSQLTDLEKSIKAKDEVEKNQQSIMQESMRNMKLELKDIESHAESYKNKLEKQKKQILQDPLTRIPNRIGLQERLEKEFALTNKNKNPLWIVIADIDHFKNVNDSYGHPVGDTTLKSIAAVLQKSISENEFVARYGGEEFVLVLPNMPISNAEALLEKIRKQIENTPLKNKTKTFNVTISIGAAYVLQNETIKETLERSDSALYRAKNNGRNQVVIDS